MIGTRRFFRDSYMDPDSKIRIVITGAGDSNFSVNSCPLIFFTAESKIPYSRCAGLHKPFEVRRVHEALPVK